MAVVGRRGGRRLRSCNGILIWQPGLYDNNNTWLCSCTECYSYYHSNLFANGSIEVHGSLTSNDVISPEMHLSQTLLLSYGFSARLSVRVMDFNLFKEHLDIILMLRLLGFLFNQYSYYTNICFSHLTEPLHTVLGKPCHAALAWRRRWYTSRLQEILQLDSLPYLSYNPE